MKERTIASVSGGKDSASMALWLKDLDIDFQPVFADTDWEYPETYDYIFGPLQDKIGPIKVVRSPFGGFAAWCRKKGMFPGRTPGSRWCTSVLKIGPIAAWMKQFDEPIINAVGVRREESRERAKLPEWDRPRGRVKFDEDTEIWRPIISWKKEQVIAMHKRHDLPPNPLYLKGAGAKRVGCGPCVCSGKESLRQLADQYPERVDMIRQLEHDVQEVARARYAERGETFESLGYKPSSMFSHRETGNWPIDEAIKWARTKRGGRQYDWFFESEPSCVEWGLCAA